MCIALYAQLYVCRLIFAALVRSFKNAKSPLLITALNLQVGIEIINRLGQDTHKVNGVNGTQVITPLEIQVCEQLQILAVDYTNTHIILLSVLLQWIR